MNIHGIPGKHVEIDLTAEKMEGSRLIREHSVEDAERYQATMIKRNLVMRALQRLRLRPGAHVVWLDQVLHRSNNTILCSLIPLPA